MIYKIREKFWGFGDNFTIRDENDVAKFQVKGEVFSWGDKLSIQDTNGIELAFINQKLLSFMPRYEVKIDGILVAEIRKEFNWLFKKFILDIPGPNDYVIDGAFWMHDYTFTRDSDVVAHVSKHLFNWTDSYSVTIEDGEDEIIILCACIIIDLVLHDEKK